MPAARHLLLGRRDGTRLGLRRLLREPGHKGRGDLGANLVKLAEYGDGFCAMWQDKRDGNVDLSMRNHFTVSCPWSCGDDDGDVGIVDFLAIQLVVAQIATGEQPQRRFFWAGELRHGVSSRVRTQRCYSGVTEVRTIPDHNPLIGVTPARSHPWCDVHDQDPGNLP